MSIYLKYSSVPVTLSRPFEIPSSRDINGNLKVVNFPNQWGTQTTSFAVSGFMSFAASSGIYLNSPNFVNASGIMAHTILSQEYGKIDASGNVIEMYPGVTGGLVYKQTGNSLSVLSDFVFDTDINKLISVNGDPGSPLYVHPGTGLNGENPTREVTTYSPIVLKPEIIIPQEGGSTITIQIGRAHV